MCLEIYIGTEKELPPIEWNKEAPQFFVQKENQEFTLDLLEKRMPSKNYYFCGSFMGCSCGLISGEGLETDAEQRENDVRSFLDYLALNKSTGLRLYATWGGNWNLNSGNEKKLELDKLDVSNFELEKDLILLV